MPTLSLPPRLGWPGVVAVAALLMALVLGAVLTPRWARQAKAAKAEQQTRVARAAALNGPRALAVTRADVADATDEVAQRLRKLQPPGQRVAAVLALAKQHGVVVEKRQQRVAREGAVQRLQLGLVGRGRYADVRAFIAAALRADAGLALDRLQLRRASTAIDQLELDLQWSLLQADSAAEKF